MAGYGSVLAQGLLGTVMGGAQAAAKTADDEIKDKVLRSREEFLSQLRMGEYKAKSAFEDKRRKLEEGEVADFYARTGPKTKPADTFTDTLGDESTGATAGAAINEARQETDREVAARRAEEARKTGKKGLIESTVAEATRMRELDERRDERAEARRDRYEDRDEARADRKSAREEARADRAAARGESAAARRESREQAERLARIAAERDWKVDADGNYRRPDGSLVQEEIREGGKLLGTKPVKAPVSKVQGTDRVLGENLDSLNRRIEQAERRVAEGGSSPDPADEDRLRKLLDEKDELLGRKKPRTPSNSSSTSSGGKPWERFRRTE